VGGNEVRTKLTDRGWRALSGPESIALIGARDTASPFSFTAKMTMANQRLGYRGRIFYVNPKRDTVLGEKCWQSIASLPHTPDVAIISVPDDKVLNVAGEAIRAGVKALVIHASGFLEHSTEGGHRQLHLRRLCEEFNVAALGPNCIGMISFANSASISSLSIPETAKLGPVAIISQSGSVASLLTEELSQFGLSFVASTGNEAVTTAEDLIERGITDTHTQVIVVFVEALRRPRELFELGARARSAGKPIIVLKTGLTTHGAEVTKGHTGALAGAGEIYKAAFLQAGIVQVGDLDVLLQTVSVLVVFLAFISYDV
jgi:acyl-CoA synthetase (NDP forming)